MDEEKNILDATEYILLALNTIKTLGEFIQYKEEIEKAVYDIRNSLLNLITKKNINSNKFINNNNTVLYKQSIRNKFKTNKTKKQLVSNNKEKLNKIKDIVIKLNTEDYYNEILTKLFGNDLKEKLGANEVSDELLTAVENSMQEIDLLKKKDELKNNKIKNIEEMEEEPREFPINEIMGTKYKYNIKNKKINKEKNSNINNNKDLYNIYQEFDFIKNLRQNDSKSNKSINKKEKPFISMTSIYGNYFDPPLQKGGISKLDDYKK
jgi:hypothetical protein